MRKELAIGYEATVDENEGPSQNGRTEMGVIPADWSRARLGETVDLLTGFPFPSSGYSASGVRLVRGSNVKRGELDWQDDVTKYWPMVTPDIARYRLRDGDIVIAMDGALVGRSYAIISSADIPSLLLQRVARIRSSTIEQGLIASWVASDAFVTHVDSVKTQTAIPHISPTDIRNFLIAIPPTALEQSAIADALSDVDGLLRALETLIAKKRAIKQGAMQQLLTGKTRLPGFYGEWIETNLGAIGECVIGLTYKPENVVDYGLLVLRASNIQNGRLTYDDNVYVNLAVPDQLITRTGDILVCVRNGSRALIGKSAVIGDGAAGLTFGAFMCVYRTKHWRFIVHAFQGHHIQRQIRDNIGATINQITNNDMKALRIKLPRQDEQIAIADVLSNMDVEIATLEDRRDKTRAIKQGMMQQLLTGRIRLLKPQPAEAEA